MSEVSQTELSVEEVKELYAFLKVREDQLPRQLLPLLNRLERKLFSELTIEELEALSRGQR